MKGKVKWFGTEKGFGFITGDDGHDIFFHVSAVNGTEAPNSGDTVSFETERGRDGKLRASVVVILSKAPKKDRPPETEIHRKFPYYGKPKYETKEEFHRCFASQLGAGIGDRIVGDGIGLFVGAAIGEMIGSAIGYGSSTSTSQHLISRTCLRCGGTAHYTGEDGATTGFQCENCGRFFTSRT